MIHVRHVQKHYGTMPVLKDVSLEVSAGEVVTIIGPSGSGKSTLLRCLNGIESVQDGDILIKGVRLSAATLPMIRRHVGMVFQNFHLFPHMSVLENILFAPVKVLGIHADHARRDAEKLLAQIELKDKMHAYPNQLSGGQKQRVAIARALATKPDIMLFDEPTSALDPEMVSDVLAVIRGVAETGMTILLVTHEMAFARDIAHRVLFMDRGQIIEDSLSGMFFQNPKTERARRFLTKVLP
jgi:ABC-type polar amino acid transport system ATPase subunit